MNKKKRVLAALSHQEFDRVPMHINGSKWVVEKLKKAFNVQTDKDLLTSLHVDIYDMRGIDLHTGIAPRYIGPKSDVFPDDWAGNIFSFWGLKDIPKQTAAGWTLVEDAPPLTTATTVQELEAYPWIQNDWFDYSDMREKLKEWDRFAIMASGGSVFQHVTYLRGMDYLMMDMCVNPEMAHFLIDKVADFYYEYFRRMFEEVGDMIDIFALADDLGMQQTLLISPELFEEYVAPKLKKMADLAHSYDIKLLLHTCGNIEIIIDRLIELGIDVLDPIQPECMDPIRIKGTFGDRICLRGGISVQNVVSRGTVEEVDKECERIVSDLKKGGGYIFSPGHPVLQDDMPIENIIAMYAAGYKYGKT